MSAFQGRNSFMRIIHDCNLWMDVWIYVDGMHFMVWVANTAKISTKTQNLPMPIVRHQRNAYKVFKDKSIYYMQQIEVDFR